MLGKQQQPEFVTPSGQPIDLWLVQNPALQDPSRCPYPYPVNIYSVVSINVLWGMV